MKVPFLDLRKNYEQLRQEIEKEIVDVLDSCGYILGPKVEAFEREFGRIHSVDYCLGVSSGTDGNHLALWALGVGPGDEVILPANTFVATAWGATLCGATPVFVDCDPLSYNISAAEVASKITARTKAIVAVHLYGQPADMDPLLKLGRENSIPVVEDAAQAHLAEYKGKRVGGLGVVSSFSFYPGKNLGAYGEAGAVATNNNELARKVRMFRDHGQSQKYHHDILGHNYRMEALQGAVLGIKLQYLEKWTDERRRVAKAYEERLAGLAEIDLPSEMPYAKHVYHLYVIQTSMRDELQKFMQNRGIGTALHYPIPIHLQNCFSHLGHSPGSFPVSEQLARRCLSLPMFPEMTAQQIDYVCDAIHAFVKR